MQCYLRVVSMGHYWIFSAIIVFLEPVWQSHDKSVDTLLFKMNNKAEDVVQNVMPLNIRMDIVRPEPY